MQPFSICPPVGSHIPFSGPLCMPAPSVCFWTPRILLGHPGSFTSVHSLTSLAEDGEMEVKYLSQGYTK